MEEIDLTLNFPSAEAAGSKTPAPYLIFILLVNGLSKCLGYFESRLWEAGQSGLIHRSAVASDTDMTPLK